VYHKPPESFVTKLKGLSKGGRLKVKEEEEDEESEYDHTEDEGPAATQAPRQGGAAPAGGPNLLDLDDLGSALPSIGGGHAPSPVTGGGSLFDVSLPSGGTY
jgi:hypothetical protein